MMSAEPKDKNSFTWITWESQPRNKSMARVVGADYHEVTCDKSTLIRYVRNLWVSTKIAFKRPNVIFVQNPSIVLSAWAVTIGGIMSKKIVIDAHNAGVFPLEGKFKLLQVVNRAILRKADLVIVSNDDLAELIKSSFGVQKAIGIADPLPAVGFSQIRTDYKGQKTVFVICSWSEDEPVEIYLDAARQLPEVNFLFSGNSKNYKNDMGFLPKNVSLLGYVPSIEYDSLLHSVDIILDLTTRDMCLVCGAYEAIAAETPVILTDNKLNRDIFGVGAVYSQIDTNSLTKSIDKVFESKLYFREQSKVQKLMMKKIERGIPTRIKNVLDLELLMK